MISELVSSFQRSLAFMRELVVDLSDEEMVLQPPGVPNRAVWTLVPVVYSCQAIVGKLGVAPWLPDDWESRFGHGSSPDTAPASLGSSKAAMLATRADAGNRLRAVLLAIVALLDGGLVASALIGVVSTWLALQGFLDCAAATSSIECRFKAKT
jgi:hypothetical protein